MQDVAQEHEPAPPEALERAAESLNDMFRRDPVAIGWLVNFHVRANQDLVAHPTVQFRRNDDAEGPYCSVGVLGVINGLLCKPPFYVVAVFDDSGLDLKGFRVARLD